MGITIGASIMLLISIIQKCNGAARSGWLPLGVSAFLLMVALVAWVAGFQQKVSKDIGSNSISATANNVLQFQSSAYLLQRDGAAENRPLAPQVNLSMAVVKVPKAGKREKATRVSVGDGHHYNHDYFDCYNAPVGYPGDGYCDGGNNYPDCYDGGDCCPGSCEANCDNGDSCDDSCGSNHYDCKYDPTIPNSSPKVTNPSPPCLLAEQHYRVSQLLYSSCCAIASDHTTLLYHRCRAGFSRVELDHNRTLDCGPHRGLHIYHHRRRGVW